MKNTDLKKLIQNLYLKNLFAPVRAGMDERILGDACDAMEETLKISSAINRPMIWRTIMKNRITKFAVAAVILITVGLGFYWMTEHGVSPAYAFEQTIGAFQNVRFMHVVRKENGEILDERWIEIGSDGLQNRYRQDTHDGAHNMLIVDDRQKVYYHNRDSKQVVIYDPQKQCYTWISNPMSFFQEMLDKDRTAVIEENVEYQGALAHRVRWLKLQIECYIDPKTKLPIYVTPYEIDYNTPPPDAFTFQIPQGVAVYDTFRGEQPPTDGNEVSEDLAQQNAKSGREFLANGDAVEAIRCLEKAVELQPMDNWSWFYLGQARHESGQFDSAIEAYTRVIEMFSRQHMTVHYCHLARGLAYREKGMENHARKDLAVALPVMVDSLRHPDGAMLFDYADSFGKKDFTPQQRIAHMLNRLKKVTGEDFGGGTELSSEQLEKIIVGWEQWWADNETSYTKALP